MRSRSRSLGSVPAAWPVSSSTGVINGGSLMIRSSPSTRWSTSPAPACCPLPGPWRRSDRASGALASARRRRTAREGAATSSREYQMPRFDIPANRRIASRYSRVAAISGRRRSRSPKPRSRAAISMLAASRFRSHSQGPGSVSSKSLTSKTSSRSGAAKPPKLERCASPQSCTSKPLRGEAARSVAMTAAAPRKKANGDTSIRPWRIGISSGTRVAAWPSRISTGSVRSVAGSQRPWLDRGTSRRAALPAAARSAADR